MSHPDPTHEISYDTPIADRIMAAVLAPAHVSITKPNGRLFGPRNEQYPV